MAPAPLAAVRTQGGPACGAILLLAVLLFALAGCARKPSADIFDPDQTSASLLVRYAERAEQEADAEHRAATAQRRVIVYDLYIKARSYALLNKLFFWLSVVSAVCVLVWPSITVMFKARLEGREWARSAVVQTTVTGIAALTFAFYSQYKDKQTSVENLMRHALFVEQDVGKLAAKVAEELVRIDGGFSFSVTSELSQGGKDSSGP